MKTRWLFLVSIVVTVVASWVFSRHGDVSPPLATDTQRIDYAAEKIQAVQANDDGDTEYTLMAQSLVHDSNSDEDVLLGLQMNWQPVTNKHYRLLADKAVINQETGDMRLSQRFEFISMTTVSQTKQLSTDTQQLATDTKQLAQTKSINQTGLHIQGQELKGNTKQQQLSSQQPLKVKQGDSQFTAKSMQINLATGDYEFHQVETVFVPNKQKNVPLF